MVGEQGAFRQCQEKTSWNQNMKGLTGCSKSSGLHLVGKCGSFRDLRQEEDPRFVRIIYSKDLGSQNSQISSFASSSQERKAGLLQAALLIIGSGFDPNLLDGHCVRWVRLES